jgi:hypothetical protein
MQLTGEVPKSIAVPGGLRRWALQRRALARRRDGVTQTSCYSLTLTASMCSQLQLHYSLSGSSFPLPFFPPSLPFLFLCLTLLYTFHFISSFLNPKSFPSSFLYRSLCPFSFLAFFLIIFIYKFLRNVGQLLANHYYTSKNAVM